jgi:hypothetical protein
MSEQDGLIELASVPDHDNLVAEAWVGGRQLCEVSYERGVLSCLCFAGEDAAQAHRELVALAERRIRETYLVPASTPMISTSCSDAMGRAAGTAADS